MIWMQEIEPHDFIQWVETESFNNGIASNSGQVELLFHEQVDKESSLVIYDGQEVDLSQDHICIDVQKEGITQLIYILKDIDGFSLEEGEKTILLDTTSPDILMQMKNQNISDEIVLDREEIVHVNILEENIESLHVLLDDEELDVQEKEFDVPIDLDNKELTILCKDVAGHEIKKKLSIMAIRYPELKLEDPKIYTSQNIYRLNFESAIQAPFLVHVYVDSNYYYTLHLENADFIDIDLSKNGRYTFQVEYENDSHFKKNLQGVIQYSNVDPVVSLRPSSTLSKEDVLVDVYHNMEFLDSGYIEVEHQGHKERYGLVQSIRLSSILNEDVLYKVSIYLKDLFGHSVSDSLQIQIDQKAPNTNLYVNQVLYQSPLQIQRLPDLHYVMDDITASMRIEYYLNSNRMDMDLEKIFKRMVNNDVLKIVTYTTDSLSNLERKEYEFIFHPEKEMEMISKSVEIFDNEEVEFERVWTLNDQNELVLKKNTKQVKKQIKPKIYYDRKKNQVRIWSSHKMDYVFVGKKRMKIQKDVMGHDYVELMLKNNKTKVVVKVKGAKEEVSVFKKEKVKKAKANKSWLQRMLQWIKRMFTYDKTMGL